MTNCSMLVGDHVSYVGGSHTYLMPTNTEAFNADWIANAKDLVGTVLQYRQHFLNERFKFCLVNVFEALEDLQDLQGMLEDGTWLDGSQS